MFNFFYCDCHHLSYVYIFLIVFTSVASLGNHDDQNNSTYWAFCHLWQWFKHWQISTFCGCFFKNYWHSVPLDKRCASR